MPLKMTYRPGFEMSNYRRKKNLKIKQNGKCYGYARLISNGPLKNGPCIDNQIHIIHEWIHSRKFEFLSMTVETSAVERVVSEDSDLLKIINRMKSGETLVTVSIGHLSVSSVDFPCIVDELTDRGCFLYFIDQPLNVRKAYEHFGAHIKIGLLEMEYIESLDPDDRICKQKSFIRPNYGKYFSTQQS
jgi:hypothetical protein